MTQEVPEFGYDHIGAGHTNAYLEPKVFALTPQLPAGARALDIGCGNGYWSGRFASRGLSPVGIDPSEQGITLARKAQPKGRFEVATASADILSKLNEPPFDLVVSFEVVEHVYDPVEWARGAFAALKPGGTLVCSTPYHGYLKNLAISLAGKWDSHLNPLWQGGHIKLWSYNTLGRLLKETGFHNLRFRGAGRLPYLWMSMVISAQRPG